VKKKDKEIFLLTQRLNENVLLKKYELDAVTKRFEDKEAEILTVKKQFNENLDLISLNKGQAEMDQINEIL